MSRRSRTLADLVPLAAVEPDGLLITSDGGYVRLLGCSELLKPRAGGPEHRELLRERLGTMAAHLPAGQALQVIVEAEPLDPAGTLARDWEQIDAAIATAEAAGELGRAGAMRRLGYGLEQ